MIDARQKEMIAETLISSKLLRHDILLAKPLFDRDSADLIALSTAVKDSTKFIRVQSKEVSVVNNASAVKIPTTYVSDTLVVFIHVDDGDKSKDHLYCFLPDDIRKWPLTKARDEFRLGVPKDFLDDPVFQAAAFDSSKADLIKQLIDKADLRKEFVLLGVPVHHARSPEPHSKIEFENRMGGYVPVRVDTMTGSKSVGATCPGNPEEYKYNPESNSWLKK